jgi:hypothetical protein
MPVVCIRATPPYAELAVRVLVLQSYEVKMFAILVYASWFSNPINPTNDEPVLQRLLPKLFTLSAGVLSWARCRPEMDETKEGWQ